MRKKKCSVCGTIRRFGILVTDNLNLCNNCKSKIVRIINGEKPQTSAFSNLPLVKAIIAEYYNE